MTVGLPILLAGVAAGLLLLLWRLVGLASGLEIGERGILPRGLGWGWIPWEEIEGAYPPTLEETEVVRLRLRVTERLARILRQRGRLSRLDATENSVEIRLDLSGSDLSAVEILQEIMAHEPSTERLDQPWAQIRRAS